MSYLYRSGTGRNNIAFTNTANSSTKYLRRLGSGRTNINWYTIPAGSTYNILQRNGTGRNNILWSNLKIQSTAETVVRLIYQAVSLGNGHITWSNDPNIHYYGCSVGINESEGYIYLYGGTWSDGNDGSLWKFYRTDYKDQLTSIGNQIPNNTLIPRIHQAWYNGSPRDVYNNAYARPDSVTSRDGLKIYENTTNYARYTYIDRIYWK